MLKSTLYAAPVLLLAAAVQAAPQTYVIDPTHTYPSFSVNHLGFSLQRGRFNQTQGRLVLDPAAKTGEVEISIQAASIDTGLAKRDDHLRGADFFNVAEHPTLRFKGTTLEFQGEQLVAVQGELTLLGVTKPLRLTVSQFYCGLNPLRLKQGCGADAQATLKRSDFGMDYALPGVGDEVQLAIQVEAYAE